MNDVIDQNEFVNIVRSLRLTPRDKFHRFISNYTTKISQEVLAQYELSASVVRPRDGITIAPVQGFGGYDGVVALAPSTQSRIRRHKVSDDRLWDAYFERRDEIRRNREANDRRWNRSPQGALRLALEHRWKGYK